MLESLFKLSKLEIEAYTDKAGGTPYGNGPLTVMFNPESFSMHYETVFVKNEAVGSGGGEGRFVRSLGNELTLDLIFDGTGASDFGVEVLTGRTDSVGEQVKRFLDYCYQINGSIHEPNYLRLSWGKWPLAEGTQGFDCRLKSLDITYTSFDRDGAPLRAELSATFMRSLDPLKEAAQTKKTSPDLSHRRLVRSGDTLPLLCVEIYGSSRHHVAVARFNHLDQLRFVSPGRELVFPPLEQLYEEPS